LSTTIDLDNGTASLKLALQVASYFELGDGEAHKIAGQVGQAVATWRKQAAKLGLSLAEIDRMASAFEHEDLRAALDLSPPAPRIKK
jgi:serine/threonine-protein kinase HipA